MASTGAVVYVKPTVGAGAGANRITGSVVLFPLRNTSGQFTSKGGATAMRNLRNLKAMKPHRSVPMSDAQGMISTEWDNYFAFLNDTFLELESGPTLPDVADSITYAQAQSLVSEQIAAALSQQANANAQSILSIREVVQTAALPGAMQIPAPKLFQDYTPGGAGNGE